MAVKPIPDGFQTVTPFLIVPGVAKVIAFLKEAFGAEEMCRHCLPDGLVMHAQVRIGSSIVMLSDERVECKAQPTMLYLYVEDVDKVYKQAIQAGGKSLREPTDEFYGDRSSGVMDPCGNQWWIATHIEDVSEEELTRRQQAMMAKAS